MIMKVVLCSFLNAIALFDDTHLATPALQTYIRLLKSALPIAQGQSDRSAATAASNPSGSAPAGAAAADGAARTGGGGVAAAGGGAVSAESGESGWMRWMLARIMVNIRVEVRAAARQANRPLLAAASRCGGLPFQARSRPPSLTPARRRHISPISSTRLPLLDAGRARTISFHSRARARA